MASTSNHPPLLLPNNVLYTTEDPLGLHDDDDDTSGDPVPVLPIITSHLIKKFESLPVDTPPEALVNAFITTISDLSYTLHGIPDPNLNVLRSCLLSSPTHFPAINHIIHAASKISELFPSGHLPPLTSGESREYTTFHISALLAHQFLLTLRSPSYNDWGGVNLTSWFSDSDGNVEPKRTYTNIFLDYFSTPPTPPFPSTSFHLLHTPSLPPLIAKTPLAPLTILELPQESDFPSIPSSSSVSSVAPETTHTTYIISSHKLIGHGPAATQEERILASIPELLPVSTFTPPLEETTALAVTTSAAHGFVPTSVFTGHGRTARIDATYNKRKYAENAGREHDEFERIRVNTFLFLNATELDWIDLPEEQDGRQQPLADFLPGMMEKDVMKAYTGFIGVINSQKCGDGHESRKIQRIVTPPWGSGAFGGDVRVKLLIIWVAASFAAENANGGPVKLELLFLIKQMVLDTKEIWWKEMIEKLKRSGVGADEVWRALQQVREQGGAVVLEAVLKNLGLSVPVLT
ncbi:hypothetical protein H072_3794 [Dactylellina haptotyla CBS 200.50]|uniref:PARG catalytic Macro domain-containing protein n=1 Tax=Dactylellina haptotyla (strain CBS 200.50) TaxID=1284197 RepID=S8BRX0_DACHA|nr:hypothetical protein H072_3794 [Dactylellina haptotyla CBS 200.50]